MYIIIIKFTTLKNIHNFRHLYTWAPLWQLVVREVLASVYAYPSYIYKKKPSLTRDVNVIRHDLITENFCIVVYVS